MSDLPTPTDLPDLHLALSQNLGWLQGLARRLVRNDEEAGDLVQDTLVAALDRRPGLDRPLRPWLAGVLRRLHLEGKRSRGRRARREQVAAKNEQLPGSDELAARLEAAERLIAAMRQLSEPYRSTIALRYREGLEPREIAERLGLPGGTVRWRLKEGLARLRAQLDGEHGSRAAWIALLTPVAELGAPLPIGDAAGASAQTSPALVVAALAGTLAVAIAAWAAWRQTEPDVSMVPDAVELSTANGASEPTDAETSLAPALLEPRTSVRQAAASAQPAPSAPARADAALEHTNTDTDAALTGYLAGRVTGPQGKPVAGALVTAFPAQPLPLARNSPSTGTRAILASVQTNAAGEFLLERLPPLVLQVRAADPNGRFLVSPPVRPSTRDGENSENLLLQLPFEVAPLPTAEPAAPTSRQTPVPIEFELRGRVQGGSAEELAGLRARLRRPYAGTATALLHGFQVEWREPESAGTVLDAKNEFALPASFLPGVDRLGVELLDANDRSLGIEPINVKSARNGAVQVVPLRPLSTLHVSTTRDPRETLQPAFVTISNGDGRLRSLALSPEGTATFEDVAAGDYEVRWFENDPYRGGETSPTVFPTVPAEPREIEITLSAGETRALHLDRGTLGLIDCRFSVDGEAAVNWQAALSPPARGGTPEPRLLSVPLDPSGGWVARVRNHGTYQMKITPSSGVEAPLLLQEFEVGDEPVTLDVDLWTCTVSGRWNSTRPAQPLWLRTNLPGGGVWIAPARLFDDGTFLAERAAPGDCEFVIARDPIDASLTPAIARVAVPISGRSDVSLP